MKLKTTSLLIAGTLFGAAMMPAQANNEAMMDLLKVLRDQGTITAQNYDLLVNAAKADKEASEATAAEVKAEVKKATADMPKITTNGKLKFESQDGSWSFQPIGRVMWDAIATDDDGAPVSDEFSGTELRRARLGFEGDIYDWSYKFEADFAKAGSAGKSVAIKDAFVGYNTKLAGNKLGLKLGQSQIAFGFNTAASSKYMTFIDRPWYADGVLSPARQSGLAAKLSGDVWSLAASATIGELSGGSTSENADGTTLAVRGTFAPLTGTNTVQLGAGYMSVSQNANGFGFAQHLSNHKDKWEIESASLTEAQFDGSDAFEVDAVGIFGPFHALAEYNSFTADNNLGSDIDVDSYSAEVGYFLTGESMKLKHGLWDGVKPKSSAGAWQVAARFESTEIDDNANNEEADMWTVGLNYYPTPNIRLLLDYSQVTSFDSNDATRDGFEPSAIKFRAQAKW